MAFVRLLAIESPSPFPSVYLDLSPLTNLSISSSGVIFNCSLDVFLKINLSLSSSFLRSTYALVSALAYLTMLLMILSNTLQRYLLSARSIIFSSELLTTTSICFSFNRSANSPIDWSSRTFASTSSMLRFIFPVVILAASIISSTSFLSLSDCLFKTSRYSFTFSLSIFSFPRRST